MLRRVADYPAFLDEAWLQHLAPREKGAPTVVSTFSGCGGSSLGYSMAGYRELLAVDWDGVAAATFRRNFPGIPVFEGDIAGLSVDYALDMAGVKEGELDVLDGSPPCQGFSTAGNRKFNDGRNQLFHEFVRLLRGIKPRAFVMENVSGMVKGKMRIIFSEIMRELKTSGYEVSAKLLNAMWFGVPQSRPRVIFVGARNDLGIKFPESGSHPRPETIPIAASGAIPGIMTTRSQDINRRIGSDRPSATICRTASGYGSLFVQSHPSAETRPVTVADALPWIKMGKFGKAWKDADRTSPAISRSLAYNPETSSQGLEMVEAERVIHDTSGQYSERDVPNRPSPAIVRGCESLFIEREADISGTAIAREWDKLRPGQASKKYFNLVRPDPDKPCPTVTEKGAQNRSIASVTHPTERRKLSIAELKRLGAFPDGFEFEGTYAEQWGQIGNSVPPLFMRAIAAHIRREILDRASRP